MPYGTTPVTPELVAVQQQVADLFHEQKLIPTAVKVKDNVWQELGFPLASH
ncbi:hypothetical protein ACU4GD_03235 [Cupriavidus basilensis]